MDSGLNRAASHTAHILLLLRLEEHREGYALPHDYPDTM